MLGRRGLEALKNAACAPEFVGSVGWRTWAAKRQSFDCVDHRADDLPGRLAAACPKGIEIYFENVGGAVIDAVLPRLNAKARITVCGLIAAYNATELPPGPDRRRFQGVIRRNVTANSESV